ncbi:MAG: UDP-N-acetylglucosamine 2-epimerase (non-hydrolyzing) [Chloroflexi bacterium]|nr:UDP-N-acetylglucosamine 2-epimerase (non-hydrolyzing) [Chloroflexota bacterium]
MRQTSSDGKRSWRVPKLRVLTIFGTRPEAIKLAPVILELQNYPQEVEARVCVTAQHREMLDQVLSIFRIAPDIDLDLMRPGQGLPDLTARVLVELDRVMGAEQPDVVLVQGDTTTVMAASLAAFYHKIPVGHVEAGLRSHNRYSPFPEEVNRRIASVISSYHFAPTQTARLALQREGIPETDIYVTGNTVIDALRLIIQRPLPETARRLLREAGLLTDMGERTAQKLILVTAHRRENFGAPFESICRGLKALVERNRNVVVLYPVHLNPNVQEPVYRLLGNVERVLLTGPVEYDVMAHLMDAAYLVLTDSGGIQEEAPALGKPVLVMRTETERPEGVEAGTARLVGPDSARILAETENLLHHPEAYRRMAQAVSPYGDGHAGRRIVSALLERRAV